jgi:hypothetical protein
MKIAAPIKVFLAIFSVAYVSHSFGLKIPFITNRHVTEVAKGSSCSQIQLVDNPQCDAGITAWGATDPNPEKTPHNKSTAKADEPEFNTTYPTIRCFERLKIINKRTLS